MSYQSPPTSGSRIQRSLPLNILLVLALCTLLYIIFFSSLDFMTSHGDDLKVPSVAGKDGRVAIKILEDAGFEVHVDSTYEPDKKALLTLQQMPDPGDIVKRGRTIFVTLNKRVPPTTPMPNLVNLSLRSAALILRSNRLVLGDTTYRPDIMKDGILEQLLNGQPVRPGTMIPQGSRISLVIGNGLGETEMNVPDVIGMAYPEAIALLSGNGLLYVPVWDPAGITDSASAKVYKQTPNAINDAGSPVRIHQGDGIDIYIGQNPEDSVMDHNRNAWKDVLKANDPQPTTTQPGSVRPSAPQTSAPRPATPKPADPKRVNPRPADPKTH